MIQETVRRCGGSCWTDCDVSPLARGDWGMLKGKSVAEGERAMLIDQIRSFR